MCNLVISRPKIESHLPQRPNFCTQEMLQLRHMEMTETLQKGDREAYLSQLLIGVGFFSITCIANLPYNLVPDIGNLSPTPHTHWFSAMTAFWQFYIPNTLAIAVFALYLTQMVPGNCSLCSIAHKNWFLVMIAWVLYLINWLLAITVSFTWRSWQFWDQR